MRLAGLVVVVVVILLPPPASAQTTTADGLAAMLAGDYASAARIFRPLAEDAASPDPLATFFLATLYHAGVGVHRDDFRACGLYLRAAVPENPFAPQSLTLARVIHHDHPLGIEECVRARDFRWNHPSEAKFTLGSEHWVRIDSNELVVGYQGAQKSVGVLSGAGWVFLSTRYTPVDVTKPVEQRRHFIEYFVWLPPRSSQPQWTLLWLPYEIVGLDVSAVMMGGVSVMTAAQPSTDPALVERIRIRVNSEGEAQWSTDESPSPRGGIITLPKGSVR
jgi:hypothetical protein